jgi:hypothetical protein
MLTVIVAVPPFLGTETVLLLELTEAHVGPESATLIVKSWLPVLVSVMGWLVEGDTEDGAAFWVALKFNDDVAVNEYVAVWATVKLVAQPVTGLPSAAVPVTLIV